MNEPINPDFSDTPSDLVTPTDESLHIIAPELPKPKRKKWILGVVILLLVSASVVYAGIQLRKPTDQSSNPDTVVSKLKNAISLFSTKDQATELVDTKTSTSTATLKPTSSPSPTSKPKASASPTSTPKPSLQPTAAPITFDITTNNSTTVIKRLINSGNGQGFYEQLPARYSDDAPVFNPVISLWESKFEICTKIRVNKTIYGYNIHYVTSLDGRDGSEQMVGSFDLPANQDVTVCGQMSSSATGTHTMKLKFNPYQSYSETNYSNNTVEAKYIIAEDTEAPTFNIYGPNITENGTCFHVNDVSDNISLFSEIRFEYKFDNNSWANLVDYACMKDTGGTAHTLTIKATDKNNNSAEKSRTF